MKKTIIAVLAVVMIFSVLSVVLVSCHAKTSADSIKSGLEKAGYKVDQYDKNTFETAQQQVTIKTSEMDGLQTVFYAYKGTDNKDSILVFVFDSIKKATVSDEVQGILLDWGRNHAPETDTSTYGTHNNVVWAGSSAARSAAGLNS